MNLIDWLVIIIMFLGLSSVAFLCKNYSKGVADFLVAGRGVGRYLGLSSSEMQGMALVGILATWQMYYNSGFCASWWTIMGLPAALFISLSGYCVYRYRQSRAMSTAQLLELRYSRGIRIFCGMLGFLAGIVNMGIFPIVSANFFVYFCGLPSEFIVFGLHIPTVLPIMIFCEGAAVMLCLLGGQVTVVVTDFVQNILLNLGLIVVVILIYRMFTWEQFAETFSSSQRAEAMVHPFAPQDGNEFNILFFIITIAFWFYYPIAWAPSNINIGSARDAHEAKMMKVMQLFKNIGGALGISLIPVAAFIFFTNPHFHDQAVKVIENVQSISNEQVRSQMLVPAFAQHIFPIGFKGLFVAIMLFALIATDDSYLLAWAGMLIQDVVVPLRRKPLSPQQHIRLLRFGVVLVAVFIITFSMLFRQSDNILMFQHISGAIYFSGASAVLLGALYWRRGTNLGAWTSLITGACFCAMYLILKTIYPSFPLNGTIAAFLGCVLSVLVFVTVSYCGKNPNYDLDHLLNRSPGKTQESKARWWHFSKELTRNDRILYRFLVTYVAVYFTAFSGVCIYNILFKVAVISWIRWWYFNMWLMFFTSVVIFVWFLIGGIKDLTRLVGKLKIATHNAYDNGRCETKENIEEQSEIFK